MNKEIKFRAWQSIENKMWQWKDFEQYAIFEIFKSIEPFILMQFTGLKDKNGKEIYEGDIYEVPINIVKMYHKHYSEDKYIKEVYFDRGTFVIDYLDWLDKIEVIGNIYENPELLK